MFENIFDLSLLKELSDWRIVTYILLGGTLLTVFKILNGLLAGYRLNQELTEKDNKAIAVSLAGFILSLCLIIHGVLVSPGEWYYTDTNNSIWLADLKNTCLWATLGCAYLLIARIINDKLILPQFSNKDELVRDQNVGVGIVQAASYISTALVIKATISSPETLSLGEELILTTIWFFCTQALLIIFAKLYQLLTKYDMHVELRNDNVAVGVAFGGNMIAFSILLSFFISTYDSLAGLIIWATISCILLWIIRIIVDKLLLPNHTLDTEISLDRNWGAGIIEAVTAIGVALIISGSFL